jgi:hypothetical protein
MDMSNQENNLKKLFFAFCFLLFVFCFSCNNDKQKESDKTLIYKQYSSLSIGGNYSSIFSLANDSINSWRKNNLADYAYLNLYNCQLDSLLCFNKQANKIVSTILVQDNTSINNAGSDAMCFLYGAKIKKQWYFFTGATIVLPRKMYEKNVSKPLSFKKLHEIAMKEVFNGYLIKNAQGQWEINEHFFDRFKNFGWVPFTNRKTDPNRFCSCEEINDYQEYLECNYRKQAEKVWVKKNYWYLTRNAPVYESIHPLKVRWYLEKGRRVSVFEYIDGGEWCVIRASGIMPTGMYDTDISYIRRKDVTMTTPAHPIIN